MKIQVYGNLILDIIDDGSHYTRSGGAANVCRSLIQIAGQDVDVSINGTVGADSAGLQIARELCDFGVDVGGVLFNRNIDTSSAFISLDYARGTKVSHPEWGACTSHWFEDAKKASWYHFSYIDKLPNLDTHFLSRCRQRGIVSADLCLSEYDAFNTERVLSLLHEIDYLIISDHEANSIFMDESLSLVHVAARLLNYVKCGVVIHANNGSTFAYGMVSGSIGEPAILENVNVLGAGDHFAASFIFNKLSGSTFLEAIDCAHKDARKFVLR